MKGKFKLLRHIGLGLFLVSALVLAVMPVAKVEAATAVTDVWVEFPAEDADGNASTLYNLAGDEALYRIHFKATTALVREVDTITVQFPDGVDTTMGPSGCAFTLGSACSTDSNFAIDADAAGTDYTYYDCTSASYGGKRITVTIGVDIAAGQEAWLMIDDASQTDMVIGADPSGSAYKVKVWTSKDTTPVLSKGFYLGAGGAGSQVTTTATTISPTAAGATNVECTFEFTMASGYGLETSDTITVTFPYGTTLPSSVAASSITVYDPTSSTGGWFTCGTAPTVDTDLRTVKLTTPHEIGDVDDGTAKVKFATTAGITNPTTIGTHWGGVNASYRDLVGYINTSDSPLDKPLYEYSITYAAASKLNFNYDATGDGYSDKYTMINMYSSPLYLQVEDQYGNYVSSGTYVEAQVTLESSSGSGAFYIDGDGSYTLINVTQALSSGKRSIYYKDSAAGTHTLTASYSGLTSATWTIQVCPAVSLYDQYDNLINTYGPTASSPAEETGVDDSNDLEYKGGYYVDNAVDAATAYDKVVLGDGNYEVDETTNKVYLDESYMTLKSLNGADYTTIDGYSATAHILYVNTDSVTIDGLTIKGLKTATSCDGIYVAADKFTIQNCKFTDVANDNIFLCSSSAAITSGTVTNNTITGIGRGAQRAGILLESYDSHAIAGVSITNNTVSNIDGQWAGIHLAGSSGAVSNIKVQGNTVSDCYKGIRCSGCTDGISGLTGTYAIANNTVTSCVEGITCESSGSSAFNLVKNTITNNNLYGIGVYGSTSGAKTFMYNTITGNGQYGLLNCASETTITAKYNWWGDASGPSSGATLPGWLANYCSLTARGSGDAITRYTTYEPWLHKSLTDVVADNASYQAADMKLVAGWNTLSTPVKLIESADTIDELIPSGMTIGYYYDGGWQQITTGYVLNACDAVYVKMSAVTYVDFKFDAGAFTTPSKDLKAGWNLISLAYLSSSGKTDLATVASVAKTADNLPGYSQLVSPSLNDAQTDLYGTARSSWAYAYGQNEGSGGTCYPGLGYWVYMQNAATLAGFEITPIVPAFGLD